jgi:hypothetical protein
MTDKEAALTYIPDWYDWTASGYDTQYVDNYYLRSGKWLSKDEKIVLYLRIRKLLLRDNLAIRIVKAYFLFCMSCMCIIYNQLFW